MGGLWEERAARNEALFREVNEQVRDLAERASRAPTAGFVCECSDGDCSEHLEVPLEAYERVRAEPRRFLVAPGHEGAFERVVEREAAYVVVEKRGTAGEIAERLDPRD